MPKDIGTRKSGVDWPTFLGPNHNSRSTEMGILKPWPKGGPPIVWTRELGVGYAAPVVSRGRLFQFSRFGDKARLTAMNSETGEELWRFEYATDYRDLLGYNNGPRCCPVVDGPRIYIYGPEGMLHCVRTEDGEPAWKVDTVKEFGVVQNFFGVGSTPIVENDLLITQVGGSPPGSPDTYSGRTRPNGSGIVAFDKQTGRVRYKIVDELASYASPVPATIGDRRWCFAFLRGSLVGFDPANGKIDFQYPWRSRQIESVNASNPVVVGDEVFISETYGPGSSLLKVRPGGYDIVWADDKKSREKAMQTHWNTAVHHRGFLYGSSGRHSSNAELRCIEWATGKVRWSIPKLTRASILLVDDHLIVLSEDGVLRLVRATPDKYDLVSETILTETIEPTDGSETQTRPLLRSPAWAAPILSHGLMYVRGKGRLVCLDLIPAKRGASPGK
ncbi:MAG: PQQ-like beta-propeller repeat protein [Pirellulales bacterium]|nr:PQQ-like beta-propeller repeat protein [Pirellulales bacterium]